MGRQIFFEPAWSHAHRQSLSDALAAVRAGGLFTPLERQALRDVARGAGSLIRTPEQCVVAFKSFLAEVANEAGIPLGRDRANLLERFITIFIEEMYRVEAQAVTSDGDCRGKATNGVIPAGSLESRGAHP